VSVPQSGLEFFRGILDGTVDPPAMAKLFGITIVEVEKGFIALTAQPQREHYNPMQIAHGGYASVLLDTCMGGAIHSALEPGLAVVTLEYKISFMRPIKVETGVVRGEGRVIHVGRTAGMSEGRLIDSNGKLLAHGTTTCQIVPMAKG
jgi:uncharacterized protein (TIGR00369 family)